MILASTTFTIDGAFIAAFFAGLVGLIGALVAGYAKIHATQLSISKSQDDISKVQEDQVVALEKVHKIVNSRDTAQRALIKEQSDRLEAIAMGIGAKALVRDRAKANRAAARKSAKKKPAKKPVRKRT